MKAVTGQDIGEQELGGSKVHCEVSGVGDGEFDDRRRVPRRGEEVPLVLPVRAATSGRRTVSPSPIRSTGAKSAARPAARVDAQAVRHVQADPGHRRSRRNPRHQAALRAEHHHLPRAHRRARASASSPINRCTSAASSTTTRPTRPRASSRSATRSTSRSSSCRTSRASWSARRSSTPGIIRHGAKMLHVMSRGDRAQAHRRRAQGLRRRLLRDVRARLRARPHRRLADGGDQRDGRRRDGGDRGEEAIRRPSANPGDEKGRSSTRFRRNIDVYRVAGWGLVDDVIDPRDTRRVLAWGLELAQHKRVERPAKRRGVIPV